MKPCMIYGPRVMDSHCTNKDRLLQFMVWSHPTRMGAGCCCLCIKVYGWHGHFSCCLICYIINKKKLNRRQIDIKCKIHSSRFNTINREGIMNTFFFSNKSSWPKGVCWFVIKLNFNRQFHFTIPRWNCFDNR